MRLNSSLSFLTIEPFLYDAVSAESCTKSFSSVNDVELPGAHRNAVFAFRSFLFHSSSYLFYIASVNESSALLSTAAANYTIILVVRKLVLLRKLLACLYMAL